MTIVGTNFICTVKSLRKCHFPKLTRLTLCTHIVYAVENRIQEMQSLSELYAPLLNEFDVQRSNDNNNDFNYAILAKFDTQSDKFSICKLNTDYA